MVKNPITRKGVTLIDCKPSFAVFSPGQQNDGPANLSAREKPEWLR
jgi:hypothetical protein